MERPAKWMTRERFEYLRNNISVLNMLLHSKDMYDIVILKDKETMERDTELTDAIEELRIAIEKFESMTGITLEVR